MPYRLLRFAWNKKYSEPRMFRAPAELKSEYDVVIIGGGGHGLAAAYYLAKEHGITNVAVLEKGYLGGCPYQKIRPCLLATTYVV